LAFRFAPFPGFLLWTTQDDDDAALSTECSLFFIVVVDQFTFSTFQRHSCLIPDTALVNGVGEKVQGSFNVGKMMLKVGH
jgi:hypothetical protein